MVAKYGTGATVAQNRRARFDYFIEDTVEAGIVLTGTEVKSLRENSASIGEILCRSERRRYLFDQREYPGISTGRGENEPRPEAAAKASASQA